MTNLEFWSEITPRDILREIYDLSASPPPPILLPDIFISVILPIRVKGEGSLAEPNKKNLLKTLAARDCCFFIREKQIVIKKLTTFFSPIISVPVSQVYIVNGRLRLIYKSRIEDGELGLHLGRPASLLTSNITS